MDLLTEALNYSSEINPASNIWSDNQIANNELITILLAVNYVFLGTLVALFGIISNVINLIVFYKQGLDSSINITFFALAISDLCGLLIQQWLDVLVNPWFETANVPMMPLEFQYMTAGLPRVIFSRITCLITVYITTERCLCITFPLHIKQIITPRRTAIAMITIYLFKFASFSPLFCISYIGWKFYPGRNRTLLGLISEPNSEEITQIVYIFQACIGLSTFAAVVILTSILIRKLAEKSSWRRSANADQGKSETMTNRDRKTMSLIILIASILILCYTPGILLFVFPFVEPEFGIFGRYRSLFISMWSFGCLLETINSSVNIFLYFKMSTKFRETFQELFLCKNKLLPRFIKWR